LYSRILTETERQKIRDYLEADGKRDSTIRSFVSRARRNRKQLKLDLRLIERLVARYEKQVQDRTASRSRE
jgi:hypothetical protein